ncbi:MAG: carboxypeptidase-like regulatory domain-containing protein [bacterium]
MRGFAAIIATAIFVLAPATPLLHGAEAQVNNSSLAGLVCTVEGFNGTSPGACRIDGIPAASVHLTKPGAAGTAVGAVDQTVEADAHGSYQFSSLADGDYDLAVSHAGFADGSAMVAVKGGTIHDVALSGTKVAATGQVVDANGKGVADAYVKVCCPGGDSSAATTGPDGGFQVTTVGGYRTFNVVRNGVMVLSQEAFVDGTAVVLLKVAAEPGRDATVQGVVTDQHATPLSGIVVHVYDYNGGCCAEPQPDYACAPPPPNAGAPTQSCVRPCCYGGDTSATTGSDGRYAVKVFGGSSVNVQVNQAGYASFYTSQYVEKGQTVQVDVKLTKFPDKTAHLVGHVTDAETGRGLGYVSINVNSPEFGVYECSDGGGSQVYPMSVTASEPTYSGGSATATGSAQASPAMYPYPGNNGCAIKVQSDGSFEAMVTPGYATVNVYYDTWRSCSTTTNADHSSATTCGPEYFPWIGTLNLTANADTKLDIQLRPKPHPDATVSGYLVDGTSHKAIPQATISFYNMDNNAGGYAQTDRDGSYKVGLRSGYHQVTVSMYGYFVWQGVLDVPAGDSPFDVVLTRGQMMYGGGCYDYCVMDGSPKAMAGPTPSGMSTTSTGSTSPGDANGSAGSGTAGSETAAFEDLHGGLGKYDAAERAKVLEAANHKSTPGLEIAWLAAALGLVAVLARRRRQV